jgi:membrane-associated phospholipid phosphatase
MSESLDERPVMTTRIDLAPSPPPFDWSAPRLVPLYAAIHLCVQGALATIAYNLCLRSAAARGGAGVGRLYAAWELSIPLLPAMVVPYLSVYALFVLTFFLCRNARELAELSLRLTGAVIVSAACFLVFPLHSGFDRPAIDGAFGALFRLIDAADGPYNMAPSLHVTTTVILAATLAKLTSGWMRRGLVAWCALIVCSTVFTWQHHLIDVVAGLALGWACTRIRLTATATDASPSVQR